MSEADRPQVGVGLVILRGGKVLLGKRKNAHGAGQYSGVGGHAEHMETFEQTLIRELAEEAGPNLKIKNLRHLCVTNMRTYKPKHYVDIGFVADWVSGEPAIMEPNKLEKWEWFPLDNLPQPLLNRLICILQL